MGEIIEGALAVVALVGSGVVAGVFFAVRVSVLPALCTLSPGPYILMHRALGRGYHPTMPLIVNGTVLAQLGLAVLATGFAQRVLLTAALLFSLGVQAVSHLANVPINRQVGELDPDAVPDDWDDPRPRWQRWHDLRTVLALAAVFAAAVAVAP